MVSLPAMLLATMLSGSGETVLLEFTADWCGPCRTMQPTLRRLENEGYPVRAVNVDRQPELARRFRVSSIPCFVLVANGRELERIEGTCGHDRLVQMFQQSRTPAPSGAEGAVANAPPLRPKLINPTGSTVGNRGTSPATVVPAAWRSTDGVPAAGPNTPPGATAVASNSAATYPPTAEPQRIEQSSPEQLALHATVRLKVIDDKGHSFATGTIIDTHGDEALVLTCGHVFRESQGRGQIVVELFAPGAGVPVPGTLISYEAEQRDIGLVSIRPGIPIQPAPVASVSHHPREGDQIFSLGCDHGQDPTVRASRITAVDRYLGPPNLEIAGHPVDGRSGGGLFTADGRLIGVCNSADLQEDRGIYAALRTIHLKLKQIGMEHICLNEDRPQNPPPQRVVHGESNEIPLQPIPPAVPAATPVSDDTEVICIVRSRSQPRRESRVLVIDRPSAGLMQHLSRESGRRQDTSHQLADRSSDSAPSSGPPQPATARGPILRAQSHR
jgi:S1-C subfamily serine protease